MRTGSRGAGMAGVTALALAAGASAPAHAWEMVQTIDQPEERDAQGRVTVEASEIMVIACTGEGENGGRFYIYDYVDRPGFRVVDPPNWGSPVGGRDYLTQEQAIEVACASGGFLPGGTAVPPLGGDAMTPQPGADTSLPTPGGGVTELPST